MNEGTFSSIIYWKVKDVCSNGLHCAAKYQASSSEFFLQTYSTCFNRSYMNIVWVVMSVLVIRTICWCWTFVDATCSEGRFSLLRCRLMADLGIGGWRRYVLGEVRGWRRGGRIAARGWDGLSAVRWKTARSHRSRRWSRGAPHGEVRRRSTLWPYP